MIYSDFHWFVKSWFYDLNHDLQWFSLICQIMILWFAINHPNHILRLGPAEACNLLSRWLISGWSLWFGVVIICINYCFKTTKKTGIGHSDSEFWSWWLSNQIISVSCRHFFSTFYHFITLLYDFILLSYYLIIHLLFIVLLLENDNKLNVWFGRKLFFYDLMICQKSLRLWFDQWVKITINYDFYDFFHDFD